MGVESPNGQLTIALEHGGLATSGRDRRRWRHGDEELHHEIDPATGRPSATDLIRVTVAAETAADAEVCATALLLAGEARARVEADRFGIPCVLVTRDDRAVLAGGLS